MVLKFLKEIYYLVPSLILLVFIYIPFGANLFFSNTEIIDNRDLKTKPVKLSSSYAQQFTDYYNDTFAGRKKLVVKYLKLKQALKIDTGQYFYGLNDWMFYDAAKINNGNSLLGYFGKFRFSQKDLSLLADTLQKEKNFYEQYGAKFALMVASDKENVYSEFMPKSLQKARVSDIALSDDAFMYLKRHTDLHLIPTKQNLLAAKSSVPYALYYKKDTHWNAIGSYVGFKALMNEINPDFNVPDVTADMIEMAGLVNQDMHPIDKDMSYRINYLSTMSFSRNEVIPQMVEICENVDAPLQQTVMIVGDSFAVALIPYLAKTYNRVVVAPAGVKNRNFYENLMIRYRPNWVVHELAERYFIRLPYGGKIFNQ